MEERVERFKSLHGDQLERMGVPESLYPSISSQLETIFALSNKNKEEDHLWESSIKCYNEVILTSSSSPLEVIVTPHIVSFNIHNHPSNGLHKALLKLSTPILIRLRDELYDPLPIHMESSIQEEVINDISRLAWDRLILYKDMNNNIMAALPYPPYSPYLTDKYVEDESTSSLMGPFPFAYVLPDPEMSQTKMSFCSISFVEKKEYNDKTKPMIDPVPDYMCPSPLIKNTRIASILNNYCHFHQPSPPDYEKAVKAVKMHYGDFVHKLHLVRQNKKIKPSTSTSTPTYNLSEPLIVYTDEDDPMQLSHPEAGLTDPRFQVIHRLPNDNDKIDVIYSFSSLFAPNSPFAKLLSKKDGSSIFINQFPYEGAFVQKDHLAREIQNQHGLPLPSWAIETYDLDVQLSEFIGATLFEKDRRLQEIQDEHTSDTIETLNPLWIIKPAKGTRSKGHVVTRNLAQILKILDSSGGSRIAQRYIENPICYNHRKVDCRCIVLMRSAKVGEPELYMHKRVFFRIAGKEHKIDQPSSLMDHEAVLTAMYLVNPSNSTENDKLPVDYKTIAKLENDYKDCGFQWDEVIVPKIHTMIRELFTGMTYAYPAMAKSESSKAIYGLDIMFEIVDDESSTKYVEPKLTEVTFCPVNNAVSDAYERDDDLYRNYNNDVFRCLYLGETSDSITPLT